MTATNAWLDTDRGEIILAVRTGSPDDDEAFWSTFILTESEATALADHLHLLTRTVG